jgi:thiamine biosynthesis lipoprotein
MGQSTQTPTRPRRSWVEQIMGLPISLHVRGDRVRSAVVCERVDAVFAELRQVDATFSTYRPDSEISRLNRGELDPDACSDVVVEVARLCELARVATDGAFDARDLPLPDGGRGYDPSGLVKGWAVERAARHLDGLAEHDYVLNAGGDIVLRAAADAAPWRVGVEDPLRAGRILAVLDLREGAVATSGTAQRGQHIVDPRTASPATSLASVTVVGPSLLWADVYATAAMADGPAGLARLDAEHDYEALVVDAAGEVHLSAAWGRRTG